MKSEKKVLVKKERENTILIDSCLPLLLRFAFAACFVCEKKSTSITFSPQKLQNITKKKKTSHRFVIRIFQ